MHSVGFSVGESIFNFDPLRRVEVDDKVVYRSAEL